MDSTSHPFSWQSSVNQSTPVPIAEAVGDQLEDLLNLIVTINFAIICEIVDIIGTVTNAINVVVFIKMGFAEQVNISLLGLAVSDLCSVALLHWHNFCYNPYFLSLELPFDPYGVMYLTGGFPHVLFTRITASITAFITLERCLCVYMPLRVKNILNPRRVKIVICGVYLVNLLCAVPFYYASQLGPVFSDVKNRTLIGLVFAEERVLIERILFAFMQLLVPLSTLVIVLVCTLIIVVKMKEKAKWRAQTSTAQKSETLANRDQRVTRMVMVISTIFLTSFTPLTMMFIPIIAEPEFSIQGKYREIYALCSSFVFILESVNASVNIFIYYKMSRKFRETFDAIFFTRKKETPS